MCLWASTLPVTALAAQTQPASRGALEVDLSVLLADPAGAGIGRERLLTMQAALQAAESSLDRASVELAMANWLLAVPTASPATRWIVGLPESNDLPRIHESAVEAQEHLARARKLLGAETEEDKDRRRELRTAASNLESFARLLGACSNSPDSSGYRQACEDAAVGMATARESDKLQVAAAAVMWQSLAWTSIGRQERALATLPEALSRPERLPYDFLSRLLRCRVLAESNEPAAAIALLMHVQAICEDWFPQQDKTAVNARRRLAAALQWKITQVWLKQLTKSSPDVPSKVEATLSSAQETLVSKGRTSLAYHLETAIPILVETPAFKQTDDQKPTTLPAATKSARSDTESSTSAPGVQ